MIPNTAGMLSRANSRSVVPMASMTSAIGVSIRWPATTAVSFVPLYSVDVGKRRATNRTSPFPSGSGSSSSFASQTFHAVKRRKAPKT
ncbi:unannotated protein [freshwater metagenome]|uniref:Unannotated protein n=1 Tax=freshwater metagenome TaxID=449393 RepID=A0A6J7NS04_9ZZZZ